MTSSVIFFKTLQSSPGASTEIVRLFLFTDYLTSELNMCKNCWSALFKLCRISDKNTGWSRPQHTHTDGVDVRLMACKGLSAHAVPDVPQFDRGVAGSWYKGAQVGRQGQAHDVTAVARENRGLLTCLNVPQCTEAEHV